MKRFFVILCVLGLLGQACRLAGAPSPLPTSSPLKMPTLQAASTASSSPDPYTPDGFSPTLIVTDAVPEITKSPQATSEVFLPLTVVNTSTLSLSPEQDSWVEARLQGMSASEKVGQMLLIGIDGDQIDPATCQLIQEITPGGVSYQPGNVVSPEQLAQLSAGLQECARSANQVPLLISIAHEGQYVNRFREKATTFPSALAQGAIGDPEYTYQAALAAGQELAYSGVNMVLGPVADVLTNYDNKVVSQRTFGGDPGLVSNFVAKAVTGYMEAGLIPVLKHFPGHGGVADDSHRLLPVDEANLQQLESDYLPPFRSGIQAGAPVVMFNHVAFPEISGVKEPASLSKEIIRMLREDLGFEGVILSDAMNMKAVSKGLSDVPRASLQAAIAGMDMLLFTTPQQAQAVHQHLLEAVQSGELPQERVDDAVRHILTLKSKWGLTSFPLSTAPEPDWKADASLAQEGERRSVILYQDTANLVPIPKKVHTLLVVAPGTDWEFYPILESALKDKGYQADYFHYSPPWDGAVQERDELQTLPGQASGYDLTLMFTWQSHINSLLYDDDWQIQMVRNLAKTSPRLIVVALKSPTDILDFPQIPTYLATVGTGSEQMQTLLDTLFGSWEPVGVNPLPGLVPGQ